MTKKTLLCLKKIITMISLILSLCVCMNVPAMANESISAPIEQNTGEENEVLQPDIDSKSIPSEVPLSDDADNRMDTDTSSEQSADDEAKMPDNEEVDMTISGQKQDAVDPRVILLMGDSYAAGAKKTVMGKTESGGQNWPDYLSDELDDYICYSYSCAGTGFISWWNGYTLPKMLDNAIRDSKNGTFVNPEEVKWVIIAAGYNDRHEWYDPEMIRASIINFVNKAKTEFPNAKIAIGEIGWCRSDKENAAFDQGRVQDVVVPIYREASVSAGAYYIGNIEYLLRNHEEAIGSDGVHPTSAGSELIASYISKYLNNMESGVTEIEYFYPDGSAYDIRDYDAVSNNRETYPVINLGDGMKIDSWERNSHLQIPEYSGGFVPQDWMTDNGPYTQLYGVINTKGSTYTGFKKIGTTWFYFYRGQLRNDFPTVINGKINGKDGWWYVDKTGKVDFGYNGFAKNKNGWWYVDKGRVDFKKNDVIQGTVNSQTGWYHIVHNKVTPGPTVALNKNGWWYIDKNGKVDFGYTGFARNKNGWWYAVKGKVDFTRNDVVQGTVNGKSGWYHIIHNKVTPGSTVAENKNGWWYIDKNGKVDFGYTGFARNKNGWWYIVKGKVDFRKNGRVRGTVNGNTAFYRVVNGKVQ